MSTRLRLLARPVVAALMATVAVVGVASAASAHGGEGVLSPVSVTPAGRSVEVSVRLTYEGDGHDATDATVTVAGDDGAGAVLTPATLSDQGGGVYSGTVELPSDGTWNLRVTAVEPPAQLALPPVTAAAAPATTTPPTTAAPTTAPTTAPTEDPADDAGAAAEGSIDGTDGEAALGDADDDGGTAPWVWVVAGVAVLVALAAGVLFVVRGRSPGSID